jgi:competence protein ComEA
MKTVWIIAISLASAFLVAGLIYLAASPPRGEAIQIPPLPTPAPLVIQVSGAVIHPGIYPLPIGSRVQNAVEAAGGFSAGADEHLINLAAPLKDGMKIDIPVIAPEKEAQDVAAPSTDLNPSQPSSSGTIIGKININLASEADLDTLPGIGPALAKRIIAYRESHGPFQSMEDIQDVSGIGPAIFERIKDLISID